MGYKATPITYKACKSPLKADANLIIGAGEAAKKFVDVGSAMKEGLEAIDNKKRYTQVDQKENNSGQADKAVDPEKK